MPASHTAPATPRPWVTVLLGAAVLLLVALAISWFSSASDSAGFYRMHYGRFCLFEPPTAMSSGQAGAYPPVMWDNILKLLIISSLSAAGSLLGGWLWVRRLRRSPRRLGLVLASVGLALVLAMVLLVANFPRIPVGVD